VRTVSLGRPAVTLLALLGLAYLVLLAAGVALAPGVVRALAGDREYPAAVAERAMRGERLRDLVRRLDAQDRRGGRLDLDLRRIERAYGLPSPAAVHRRLTGSAAARRERGGIYGADLREGEAIRARLLARLAAAARMLSDVERFERASPGQVRETPSASPLAGRDVVLVASFGRRVSPFTRELAFHTGLDLAAPAGTPVRAPADGRVAFAGRLPPSPGNRWWQLGNLAVLVHGDRFATVFGHCATLAVRSGQTVARGEVVATVGATGWAAGPQLHYEVWRRGEGGDVPVDPRLYMLDRRWPDGERLLAAGPPLSPADYDPLPIAPGRLPRRRGSR
jgi:murein DD-endopeptidase MepM/ murein hydrolase activator NlpD